MGCRIVSHDPATPHDRTNLPADLKTLSYEFTIDDPGAYTTQWSGKWTITEKTASSWVAGGEMFEYICQDSRS